MGHIVHAVCCVVTFNRSVGRAAVDRRVAELKVCHTETVPAHKLAVITLGPLWARGAGALAVLAAMLVA